MAVGEEVGVAVGKEEGGSVEYSSFWSKLDISRNVFLYVRPAFLYFLLSMI